MVKRRSKILKKFEINQEFVEKIKKLPKIGLLSARKVKFQQNHVISLTTVVEKQLGQITDGAHEIGKPTKKGEVRKRKTERKMFINYHNFVDDRSNSGCHSITVQKLAKICSTNETPLGEGGNWYGA